MQRVSTWIFVLASVVALTAAWRPAPPSPGFLVRDVVTVSPAPHLESHVAQRPQGVKEVHGSSLTALPGNELLLVYYGGTTESALDVKIYQQRFREGVWQEPKLLMTPELTGQSTHRYTRRVGNCSIYRDSAGRLHLFFVSVGYFGWSCSSINQMISTDNGESWFPPKRLITTPLINISTLVRSPAVPLLDGGFLLPVYYELTNKFPEAIEFDALGNMLRKVRLTGEHGILQACVVPVSRLEAHVYARNRLYEETTKLNYLHTYDAGRTWSQPVKLNVSNLDSPVSVIRLAADCFVMAYNPTFDREVMRLATSRDGRNWRDLHVLDSITLVPGHGELEYSYPTFTVSGDVVDLIYTYHRIGFRHMRFNLAWLKEQLRD